MKKICITLLIISIAALALTGCGAKGEEFQKPDPAKTVSLDEMKLVFEDDFNGTSLDTSKWSTNKYFDSDHEYIRRGGFWDGDQVKLDGNGNLLLTTAYKTEGKYGPGWYTGMLHTRGKQEFNEGYFEVRCKAPKAQGLWSAFWLLSDTMTDPAKGGKNGAEIDVFESPYFNDPKMQGDYKNSVFHTLHVDGYGDSHQSKQSPYYLLDDIYDTFHTYGVYWDQSTYIFYVDGQETWRTSWKGTPRVNEYMILSVELAGKDGKPDNENNINCWAGELGANPEGTFPVDFTVDYVRAYQKK